MLNILDDFGCHFFTRLTLNSILWVGGLSQTQKHLSTAKRGREELFWCLVTHSGGERNKPIFILYLPTLTFHKGFKVDSDINIMQDLYLIEDSKAQEK